MHYLHLSVIYLVANTFKGAYGTLISDIKSLGLSVDTQIAPASSSTNFTQRWSSYDAPSYVAIVKPATDSDVAKIVKYAANSATPFLTTGGGHGFAITLGGLQHGIELDLSNFNNVTVDTQANRLTIGGAVRFRDVIGPLGQAHRELPIGSESCVGMVGATLGGGVGRYNGLHGMLLDSLLSVKMVTAAGSIVTASTTENSDLFWGIRGAGFNYGTILEATYSIYNETAPVVLNADFIFPPNASKIIFQYFKSLENNLPAKLSLIFLATYAPALNGSFILINAVYAGPKAEGEAYLQPLLNAFPIISNLTMIPWSTINAVSLFGNEPANYTCPVNSPHNVYGSAVHHFDIPTFQTFYENYNNLVSSLSVELSGTVFFIEFFAKQAVQAIPYNATAYPWRNITAHLLFNFAYNSTSGILDRQINEFGEAARRNFTAVSGFVQPELYVLYGHGDEDPATLYSAENLPALRKLKAEWDPKNVYRYQYPLIS